MHYSLLVVFDEMIEPETRESAIIGRISKHNDRFDWFQLGGRWTGLLDGYNPGNDDSLLEVCNLCNGTGERQDMVVAYGCNGCMGTGKRRKWPTLWPIRREDMAKIGDVDVASVSGMAFAILDIDGVWSDHDQYGEDWQVIATGILSRDPDKYIAVVDCHD